jgi:hypothetical protein
VRFNLIRNNFVDFQEFVTVLFGHYSNIETWIIIRDLGCPIGAVEVSVLTRCCAASVGDMTPDVSTQQPSDAVPNPIRDT